MGAFGTAVGGKPFNITYNQLLSNSVGLADADGDILSFQVDSGVTGAVYALNGVTQNSFPFNVAPGQTLSFTPGGECFRKSHSLYGRVLLTARWLQPNRLASW